MGIPSLKPESRISYRIPQLAASVRTSWVVEVRYLGPGVLTDWVQIGPAQTTKDTARNWALQLARAGIKRQAE